MTREQILLNILVYVIVPLTLSNVLHMLIVKNKLWQFLAVPININRFGANKTWRGFIVLLVFNSFFEFIVNTQFGYFTAIHSVYFGAALAFSFSLFELPNSWIKRKLGIDAGKKPKRFAWAFTLIDKSDSVIGATILTAYVFHLTCFMVFVTLLSGIVVHLGISAILLALKIKAAL